MKSRRCTIAGLAGDPRDAACYRRRLTIEVEGAPWLTDEQWEAAKRMQERQLIEELTRAPQEETR